MSNEKSSSVSEDPSLFSKGLSWAAYPISALAGLWTAKVNIGDAVYDRLKIDKALDDIRTPLTEQRAALSQEATSDILSGQITERASRYAEKCNAADKAYFPKVEARIKALGLEAFADQWKFVHRSQKQSAIMNGVFMSSVTLGAILGIADSKVLAHLFSSRRDEQTPPR
jgi:hypothetical protein